MWFISIVYCEKEYALTSTVEPRNKEVPRKSRTRNHWQAITPFADAAGEGKKQTDRGTPTGMCVCVTAVVEEAVEYVEV